MEKRLLLSVLLAFCSLFSYGQTYIMGTNTGTQSTCSGNFYDSGGSGGNYQNGENQVITFCPAVAGQAIQVNFSSFSSESGFDFLYVFNGNSTAANQIGSYTGAVAIGAITASNASGCLTFSWHSDGSVISSGWAGSVSCVNPPPPTLGPASSCGAVTTSNSLCSSSASFNLGTAFTTMPTTSCLGSTYGVGWYVLQAQNTNPIQITLTSGSDVDFALWGPFMSPPPYNCSALGATVDCSFSGAATEYVDILSPITGAYYLLAVSNYGGTTGNINLNLTAGTIPCAASPVCNISNLTATPSACNPATNTYSLSGAITFSTPPASGTLTVTNNCGGSQTFNPPFNSPINYNLTGLTSTGAACTVLASFSATSCSRTQPYNAPAACYVCATTASNNGPICTGGSANLSATNVTNSTGYTWAGPSGFSASGQNVTANNLTASGTYSVTVTTSLGCTSSATTLVQVNSLPTTSNAGANISLCNSNTFTLAANTPAVGTGTWSVFSGSANISSINSPTATATLIAGTSAVLQWTISNSPCAASSSTMTITNLAAPSVSISPTSVLCNGGNTGSAVATANGGTAGYTYSWSPISGSNANIANLTAGIYTCFVQDANSCTASASGLVNQPTAISANATANPASCNGGLNGSATINASGGTPGYTYAWSSFPPQTTQTATNLGFGAYTCVITDANNCTAAANITVSQPTLLSSSATNTPILCNGGTSTVTVSASGGTLPYTGTGNFTVNAGVNNLTVTDANGCTSTSSLNISEPTALVASATNTPILCNGGTSTVTVSASGGTAPYTGTGTFTVNAGTYSYTVTDANGCTSTTSITITEPTTFAASSSNTPILCNGGTSTVTVSGNGGTLPYNGTGNFTVNAGSYTYNVTDANGCAASTSITVTEPTLLVASSSATTILCNGGTADITVSASGGTAPYTGTGIFAVSAGTYSYTVTDANGCTSITSITITEPTLLQASNTNTPILCNGGTSTVTVSGSGGTLPYTGTGNFTEVVGSYSYTITDANGCTATTSVTISEPTLFTSASSATAILCNGGTSTVTVSGNGGTLPYTGTGNFTEVAGSYSYNITDANGCTSTTSISISEPTLLQASSTATAIACNGGTADITVSASGGTLPYTGTGTFTVNAGTYSYTVTDANGCSSTTSINVGQAATLTISLSASPILCNGGSTNADVVGGGGTLPYTGTGSFTVNSGTYNYTITDANGCSATDVITISEPTLLTSSSSSTPILCFGNTSTVTVAANGGTLPYTGTGTFTEVAGTYTYNISDANGCATSTSITITEPTLLTIGASNTAILCNGGTSDVTISGGGGTLPYTGTGVFTVNAGAYNYTITDANGCTASTPLTITEPTLLVGSSTNTPILCNGGTSDITVSATGGTTPYTGTGTFTVNAGTFTYNISDANGCATSTSINVTEPTLLVAASSSTQILCNGGTSDITVSATGGTAPYNGTGTFTVAAGTYSYTVTDANGCSSITSITITEPTLLNITASNTAILCNGGTSTVVIGATGGTPNYTGTGTFTVPAGSYTYNISDANGCTASTSFIISEPTLLVASSTNTPILCNGGTSDITVSASGGVAPYTGTGTFTVNAGTYTYNITDANGCATTTSIVVNEPTLLVGNATASNISCNGGTATVLVSATGGTPVYTGTGTFTVTTGTYTYNITDANGCATTASVTVGQPNSLGATATATAILCNGGTSTVTVAATGGTPTYTGTGTFTVNAGAYSYTVTDANGCSTTASITITEPALLTAVSTNSSILCNGGSSVVTVLANGGTLPYTGTGNITTNAGNYTYTITDANGCTAVTMGNISQPAPLAATITGNPITCFNGNTLLTVNASGGTAPYTGTGNFTVNAGTYTYNISDANGCTTSANTTVAQPTALSASVSNIQNVKCNGLGGMATIAGSGGSGNYLYSWIPGNYNQNAPANIPAGNYTVYVKDAADVTCMTSVTLTIGTAAPLSISNATVTNLGCNAACDGEISVTAAGASGAYSYAWSNGASTASVLNLCAGTYTVTVSDAQTAACSATATYTVVQPTALTISLQNQQNVLCNGGNNGAILVQANGGWGNYQYFWSNGQTGNNATNLAAGNYSLLVTDSICDATQTFIITEPMAISLLSAQVTNATCSSANNGSISVVAAGGSGNYTYSWSGSTSTLPTITGLAAGNYSIFVTDAAAAGCTFTQTLTVVDTSSLSANVVVLAQPSCNLSDGMISVVASGGSGNYGYLWWNGATTSSVSNLPSGVYSVTVSEANAPSCAVLANITLNGVNPPENVSINSAPNVSLCEGESALLSGTATGANSYVWLWNGTAVGFGLNFSATEAGFYQFVAYSGQGANGCSAASELVELSVTKKADANVVISGNSAICSGDSILLIASGGDNYQWLENGQVISGAKSNLYWVKASGIYSVIASTVCNSDTSVAKQILVSLGVVANFTYEPSPVFEGQTVQFVNQSVNATTWSWAFGDNIGITLENPAHLYENAGQYPILLVAQDVYGCVDTLHSSITVLETDNPFIPNVFTPNGDGTGDVLVIEYMDLKDTHFAVFDRWGVLVFKADDQSQYWNGKNTNGDNLTEGVYFYVLEGKTALGKNTTHKGSVTLIR